MTRGRKAGPAVKVITGRDIKALKFIYLNGESRYEDLKKNNLEICEKRLGRLAKCKYLDFIENINKYTITNKGFKETGLPSKKQINYLRILYSKYVGIEWEYKEETKEEIGRMFAEIRSSFPDAFRKKDWF